MPYPPELTEHQRLELADEVASLLKDGAQLQADLARSWPKLLRAIAHERIPLFVYKAQQLEKLLLSYSQPYCQFEMADASCCPRRPKTAKGFCRRHSKVKCANCGKAAIRECRNHSNPICDKCQDCGKGHSSCFGFAI